MNDQMTRAHRQTIESLPWYVNGTLEADERARVERHLGECLTCRAALREEQRTQVLVREQQDVPLSAEHGLSDLLSRIDSGKKQARPTLVRPVPVYALTIGAFVIVIGSLFLLSTRILEPDQSSAAFSTLSDTADIGQPQIDIVFADSVDDEEIAEIVDSFGGRLIGGPTALGRYTVALPPEEGSPEEAVIERLAGDERIRFVGRSFIGVPEEAAP